MTRRNSLIDTFLVQAGKYQWKKQQNYDRIVDNSNIGEKLGGFFLCVTISE